MLTKLFFVGYRTHHLQFSDMIRAATLPPQFSNITEAFKLPGATQPVWNMSGSVPEIGRQLLAHLGGDFAGANMQDCMLLKASTGIHKSGQYMSVVLGTSNSKRSISIGAHRLVCWIINLDDNDCTDHTRHTCHNGCCINPLHLVFGTAKDNSNDRKARQEMLLSNRRDSMSGCNGKKCQL